jgi:hypothetical protein
MTGLALEELVSLSASHLGALAHNGHRAEELRHALHFGPARHPGLIGKCRLYTKEQASYEEASDPHPDKVVTRIALREAEHKHSRDHNENCDHRSAPGVLEHSGLRIEQHPVCKTPQHKMPQQIIH